MTIAARSVWRCTHCGRRFRRREGSDAPPPRCPHCDLSLVAEPPSADARTVTGSGTPSPLRSTSLPPGTRIGHYTVESLLGRGGMGTVYRARQESLGRRVALKVLALDEARWEGAAERFRREAEAAARLQHPNIVEVHEFGRCGDLLFYSMDLVEGAPLDTWFSEPRPLSARLGILHAVAEAAGYAHAHGVVHRDLKPGNILVDAGGKPHVLDFGLAKLLDARPDVFRTQSGVAMGTPAYMPPEMVEGRTRDVGPHSDVFALGVMLFETATGRLPFLGKDAYTLYRRIVEEETPIPSEIRRGIDPDLERIILKALAKDPADRYADGTALAEEIGRFLDGKSPEAPTPHRRRGRRRNLAARFGAAAAVGAAAVVLLVTVFLPDRGATGTLPPDGGGATAASSGETPDGPAEVRIPGPSEAEREITRMRERIERREAADVHLRKGTGIATAGGDWDAALATFAEAERIAPDYAEVYAQRGRARFARGLAGAARPDLERASELRPDDPLILADLWFLYNETMDTETAPLRDRAARRIVALDPDGPAGLLVAASDASIAGNLPESIRLARRALELDPGWALARIYLANRLFAVDEVDAAEREIDAVLRGDAGRVFAWLTRAQVRRIRKDSAGALADVERALALNPDDLRGLHIRGDIHQDVGRFEEAARDYERIRDLAPDLPDGHYAVGRLFYIRERYTEAVGPLRRAVAIRPDHTLAIEKLGIALARLGRYDEAVPTIEEGIRRTPSLRTAQRLREVLAEIERQRRETTE